MPGARSLLLEDRALGVRILVNAGTRFREVPISRAWAFAVEVAGDEWAAAPLSAGAGVPEDRVVRPIEPGCRFGGGRLSESSGTGDPDLVRAAGVG
jgi:hypothetical protein